MLDLLFLEGRAFRSVFLATSLTSPLVLALLHLFVSTSHFPLKRWHLLGRLPQYLAQKLFVLPLQALYLLL